MANNETTRRRRVHGRTAVSSESSSTSRTDRPNTSSGLHQHHHHHDHHHHHYHYHHHYHHFPRSLNADQEQGSSGATTVPVETSGQADRNQNDRPGHVLSRSSGLPSAMLPREAANEGRDRLDERLRSSAMQSHRPGFRANLLEEFSLLFEDDEDPWSDDELLELGIQEWLAAVGFEEAVHSDAQSLPERGLSKAFIRRLPKVVFVPREDNGVGSISLDQEDCSVCLEHFVVGQQLICLPCKHRFHPNCLTPWLELHAKCPYCRAKVSMEATSSQTGTESAVPLIEDDLIAWMEAVDSGLSQLSMR